MNQPSTASSYDALPYISRPHLATYPHRVAAVARLFGMQPAPENVERCRVLELGCAQGGNILPMAVTMPQSEFYAVDASRRQIEVGCRKIHRLGLQNIRLEQIKFSDFPKDAGLFHYIIAHGIYSWISSADRDVLLEICQRHLAPNGVVYLSYNVLPGWHDRLPVREALRFHVRDTLDPDARLKRAMSMLDWVHEANQATPRASFQRFEDVRGSIDDMARRINYLYHDLMEGPNEPVLFSRFVAHATEYGLQYVGEADVQSMQDPQLSAESYRQISEWSKDVIEAQQYLDFLTNRQFRRSLLRHASASTDAHLQPDRLRELFLASQIACQHPTRSLASDEAIEFRGKDKFVGTASHPLSKAVLLVLTEAWPQPLPWQALMEKAAQRLRDEESGTSLSSEQDRTDATQTLARMCAMGALDVFSQPPQFCLQPGDRPLASPWARLQAEEGESICNLLHIIVEVDEYQRELLPLLDGSRDRDALLTGWTNAMARKRAGVTPEADVALRDERMRATLATRLDADLDAFARTELLLG